MAKLKCGYVVSTWAGTPKHHAVKSKAKALAKARALAKKHKGAYAAGKMVTVTVEHVCRKTKGDSYGSGRKIVKDVLQCTSAGACKTVRERAKRFFT